MTTRGAFVPIALSLALSLALIACGDWKNTQGSSAGVLAARSACFSAAAGRCTRDYMDSPTLRVSCESAGGVYRNSSPLCPAADNVGTCACPAAPDGTFVAPIDFYAPLNTCSAVKSACLAGCYRDASGNPLLAGTFSGPC